MPGRLKGLAATRVYRRYLPRLGWCRECGVPVLDRTTCPLCGTLVDRVEHLAPPGDVRPAMGHDFSIVREAASNSVGKEFTRQVFPDGAFVLFNRIQAIDAAEAVIVDGHVVGVLLFDIVKRKWVFKPDYYGAKLVVDEQLGPYAVVGKSLGAGQIIEPNELVEAELPEDDGYVALRGRNGYGVAKKLSTGALRVLKVWTPRKRVEIKPRPTSLRIVLEANRERLEKLEASAIEFLLKVKRMGRAMIAISGGKDSSVAAALAVKAGIREAYFLDTGLEFPETIETAEKLSQKLGLKTRWIAAGDSFWKALHIYGPPARDYRWCCKVVKLAPLARQLKPFVMERLVTITGQRGYESTQRAQAGQLAPSASTGLEDLIAAPIQYWTSLDVFLYINRENLPLNPLYLRGYDRIGCYLCPASRLSELETVKKTHPSLWSRWEEYLSRYARERSLPRQWVDYGLWRWRFSFPGEIVHLAKKLGINMDIVIQKTLLSNARHSLEYSRKGTCHTIQLDTPGINLDMLRKLLRTTGLDNKTRMAKDKLIVEVSEADVSIIIHRDSRIEVCSKSWTKTRKIIAVFVKTIQPLYMLVKCYGCGICVASCPENAMKAPHTVDPSRCTSCSTCVHTCPSASKLSRHTIVLLEKQLPRTRVSRGTHPHSRKRR